MIDLQNNEMKIQLREAEAWKSIYSMADGFQRIQVKKNFHFISNNIGNKNIKPQRYSTY